MSSNIAVLSALDNARTRPYHLTTIIITGMGLFTGAYDQYCISTMAKLIGRLYYYDGSTSKPGRLPHGISNFIVGVSLVGTLSGHLVFGWLGDKVGRKNVYGLTLILMAFSAIFSGLSFGYTPKAVLTTLCFFRFWLGFGIGGDNSLSATIMSEYANKKARGAFISAVFAMQRVGFIFAGLVSLILSSIFLEYYEGPNFSTLYVSTIEPEADYVWRILLMLGALPAIFTFYWRMKMPETGRYTALIEGNATQAALDMGRVLNIEISAQQEKVAQFKSSNEYNLLSSEFIKCHGAHLIGTTTSTFLLHMATYSQNLTQIDVIRAMGLTSRTLHVSVLQEMYVTSRAMLMIASLGIFPGYWFTVGLIEEMGRFYIQLLGFFMMYLFMFIVGWKYDYLKNEDNRWVLVGLYELTYFFANFGPNSTTFVLAAELFPTRMRSTCHAISMASGKVGSMIAAFGIQHYTQDGDVRKIKKAIIVLAFTNLIGFFCTLLVTETKGRSLEEISGEDGGRDSTRRR